MIKVSVIMPVYNEESFLEESLGSVVNQTLREIEIICVDDGSTDGTEDAVKTFKKDGIINIRYYKSQPWAVSCTEMVGFFAELDGDDTLTVDDAELKDAKWFPYDEIPENATHLSIAQELIDEAKARLTKKNNG